MKSTNQRSKCFVCVWGVNNQLQVLEQRKESEMPTTFCIWVTGSNAHKIKASGLKKYHVGLLLTDKN